MRIFNSFSEYDTALEAAIIDVMETDVTKDVKAAVKLALETNVYSKEPIYKNRRHDSGEKGGLSDPDTMHESYNAASRELEVSLDAGWQNRGFRKTTGMGTYDDLSEAIETKQIYNMPKRPFIDTAEREYEKHFADFAEDYFIKRGL